MLDLETGVHLEEVEILVAVEEEFDGPGIGVTGGFRQPNGCLAHTLAQVFADDGRGGFFNDLLMAALDGAFAFSEGDAVAMLVGDDLYFNVTRSLDELFEVDLSGSESALCLAAGGSKCCGEFFGGEDGSHAFTSASGSGFEHHGIANRSRDVARFLGRGKAVHTAGGSGHASLIGSLPRVGLGAKDAHCRGGRPDEPDPSLLAGLREVGILGEKSVAGMDGVSTRAARGFENQIAKEIGFAGRSGAEAPGLIGLKDMKSGAIGVGVNSHGRDAEFTAGPMDAKCDFAAISDEYFAEHCTTG
jgi:hypothetical protein